jgi:hypothetical protein
VGIYGGLGMLMWCFLVLFRILQKAGVVKEKAEGYDMAAFVNTDVARLS